MKDRIIKFEEVKVNDVIKILPSLINRKKDYVKFGVVVKKGKALLSKREYIEISIATENYDPFVVYKDDIDTIQLIEQLSDGNCTQFSVN